MKGNMRLAVDNDKKSGNYSGSTPTGGDGGMTDLERRVGNLETDVRAIRDDVSALKIDVAVIKSSLPNFATKADTILLKTDISDLETRIHKEFASMTRWMIGTLLTGISVSAAVVFGILRFFPINLPPVQVNLPPQNSAPPQAAPPYMPQQPPSKR